MRLLGQYLLMVAFCFSAYAKTNNKMVKTIVVDSGNYEWTSDKEFSFQKTKALERANRKVASDNELNDDTMSAELKHFREKFLAIKTPNELDTMINELDANYEKYPSDLKMMAALIIPMKNLRAFNYRIYPFITKEKITHSVALTQVLNMASFMKINLPTDQWMAGFKYISEPIKLEDESERIFSMDDFQNFVGLKVYPALLKAATRISKIKITDRMIWDNKLFYGTASFSDNLKRFKSIGEAERLAILSGLHSAMANVSKFESYNFSDIIPYSKEVASLYGYDSAFLSEVDGVTAKKVHEVLIKSKYRNLFTLKNLGEKNLLTSLKHLRESTRLALLAWTEMRERTGNESELFNSEIFTSGVSRIDHSAEVYEKMLAGPTTIRSDVTGEIISVNIPTIFTNPVHDLKSYFPNGFEESTKMLTKEITEQGKSQKFTYRNYFYGRTNRFDFDSYKTIFPEIKSGEGVLKMIRIVNQSLGADFVATNLNPFVMY
jgi:hypothetical protein